MKHYGDITQIKGSEVPIVDIVTGGSPCQDLSVAGKRAGLSGERSGLFMEQIRVIKEMRDYDRSHRQGTTDGRSADYIRPRYMVWENVPGAFSSNKGEDFRAVLEETAKVAEGDACIPGPPNGRWPHAGCIVGDGWSIAWRVHDAQFWGVPQRRKRISLVADFGGESAPEILFEREGVSGDSSESGKQGQDIATDVGDGVTESSRAISFQERAGKPGGGKGILIQDEHTGALSTLNNQSVCYSIGSNNSEGMKSDNPTAGIHEADTARSLDSSGGNPACNQGGICVLEGNGQRESHKGDGYAESEISYTLNTIERHAVCCKQDATEPAYETYQKTTGTLSPGAHAGSYNGQDAYNDMLVCSPAYGIDRAAFNQGQNAKYDFSVKEEQAQTLVSRGPGGVFTKR